MKRLRLPIKSFGKKLLLVSFVLILLLPAALPKEAWSQTNVDKQKIVRQVAQNWIRVGTEQYKRGFYKAAEKSFLMARDYQEYLTVAEREKLNELLEETRIAQGAEPSAAIESKPQKLPEAGVGAIAVELPGVEPEPARGAEQEIAEQRKPAAVAEPVTARGGYIDVINRRRNILCSHTKAVVNDAIAKAQSWVSQGEFDKATEAVEKAQRTVNENQLHLGDELFKHYLSQLRELAEKIDQQQKQRARLLEEQKRSEAIGAQRRYREQVEAERSKRIAELMSNTIAYQKQQRYEEALGQLESLLAIDPLNDRALTEKQMLEDMISFRKQLEVQKEAGRERAEILLKTDETGIPYAKEMTLSKQWREIIARPTRKPDEAIGEDPVNVAVYKQLEQIVDLYELSPEMPFGEAIELLENSIRVGPPLQIQPDWRELEGNAGIDVTTPIKMDPISGISLGAALELLLDLVSPELAELGYVVDKGVIRIATVESLPSKLITLVYDVTDLVGRPAEFFTVAGAGGAGAAGDAADVGGGFTEEGQEEIMTRDEREASAFERMSSLIMLIQETVVRDSWFAVGGEGTIIPYENKKISVRQSREVHNEIKGLLKDLRKSYGQQVAIEARFLLVGENFLEDIGLDIDFTYKPSGSWGLINFAQNSLSSASTSATGVPGSLGGTDDYGTPLHLASTISGGYFSSNLNDLQVRFLLRATQAHKDSKALTAPKVTVLSGESASLRVQKVLRYAREIDVDTMEVGETGRATFTVTVEEGSITSGTILNVTPTITPDKKHVLLNIEATLDGFLGFRKQKIDLGLYGAPGMGELIREFPETEVSRVQTRVSVPDGGTLLLGGQKITEEVERETGVPILSKIPILGRMFSNRTKVRDHKILLILIKPTIILQEEVEAEALAAMESSF